MSKHDSRPCMLLSDPAHPPSKHTMSSFHPPSTPSNIQPPTSSPTPESPCLIRYPTPTAFLRAALPSETWHTNYDLGSTLHYLASHGDEPGRCLWWAVWTGEKLELTLTRLGGALSLCSPRHSASLPPAWLTPRMQLLASALYTLITSGSQPPLSAVRGAVPLVQAFTGQYELLSSSKPEETLMQFRASHCPRARISPSRPLPEGHEIRLVEPGDHEALEKLTQLVREFRATLNGPASEEVRQAAEQAELGVRGGEYMVYVIPDEGGEGKEVYAGYTRDGRFTARQAAIRNVFTRFAYRRRGIAEALTRAAVLRLLEEPHRLASLVVPLLTEGGEAKVQDVNINTANGAANLAALGVYGRVGFGVGLGTGVGEWEEEDGRSWEECVELGYPAAQDSDGP
ncbi:hypothetical protein CALCODRAFT_342983 [Calocera cornea HHB12733]|uniref:N-acetyltransferase domain-containing protein n=1 Tax=Calocera cornea HHB12733 TaxID=1353952 RepID=A0A165EXH8_9BASI|nr:hypothetical protein CALCODRAFT_342983 [Calocera cornea HHB12733]